MEIALPVVVSVKSFIVATVVAWIAVDASRRGRNWIGWTVLVSTVSVLAVPLVALNVIVGTFITTFLVQVARVEGRAMAPTIEDQDRLVVNKLAYRHSDILGRAEYRWWPVGHARAF